MEKVNIDYYAAYTGTLFMPDYHIKFVFHKSAIEQIIAQYGYMNYIKISIDLFSRFRTQNPMPTHNYVFKLYKNEPFLDIP